ncbi:TetR/AcrR family transcriptional regulator [Desulforhopalus vacuolatus]|uniref:TetR/AcrR family transcriptional regulator n=1 Tax=Desulforhopalus vacuolatus TaxID=40414 RepID=UPI001962EF4D|nr:TetR/AcrR family transcriptional regulator [Desulforhopalus vacuolatus]MBM9519955.1 TetR/AcrR family transcriptional regulator [Desulforhopalus vacuolatus]
MRTENKHKKIIAAAIKVFAKKGFFNARISDIAKEAKVADGTIYLYFNNKNSILLTILEEEFGKIVEKTSTLIAKEDDPAAMLHIFIEQHLRAMKKNKNLAEVLHTERRQTGKMSKDFRAEKFSEYEDLLTDIISKGKKMEVFSQNLNVDIIRRIIFGALEELSRVWNDSLETHYSVEELSSQLLATVFTGIQAPLAPKF